jgi:hypothetical protein
MRSLKTVLIFVAFLMLGMSGCGNDDKGKEASMSTSSGVSEQYKGEPTGTHDSSEAYTPPEPTTGPEAYTPTEEYTPTELTTGPEAYTPPEEYTPTELQTPPER